MIVITGDAFNRPLLKLQDGANGFQDTNITNALPLIHIQHNNGDSGESCLFYCQLKNLNFDLGNNPGAVAIKMASAQDTQLSNIQITGQNFAAGFTGIPGRNSGTFNCEVTGGKYAFYINNSLGATLYGIRCVNQSVAALHLAIWRGPAIVGLEIVDCKGTGIICRNNAANNIGSQHFQGHFVLTDARIELNNSSNFAFDIADRALIMRNVFVKGTNNLVKTESGNWVENIAQWGRIKFSSFLPTKAGDFEAYNLINDMKNSNQMKDFELTSEAPSDFTSKHIPLQIYAFNSPNTVSADSYGASPTATAEVNYVAIQRAINENNIVFIPAGNYALSAPLVLKNNSVILGDPGKRTQLKPTYTPTNHSWVITTPDIIGYTVIQDLAFDTPDKDYYGAIKWETSNGFILNVRNYFAAGSNERAKHNYVFKGNAGGQFFGIMEHNSLVNTQLNPSPDYRKVTIEGTTHPITFYGLNLERGGNAGAVPQNPYATLINASNVRVFGTKSETDGFVYHLSGCNNISLNFIAAHAHIENLVDSRIVGISNQSTNIEVNMVICPITTSGLTMIDDETNDFVKRNQFLGTYRIGQFDPTVFDTKITHTNNRLQSDNFNFYPTITKGTIQINNSDNLEKIKLLNLAGITQKEWKSSNQISLSDCISGLYFLQLCAKNGLVYNHKIIKQ
jgi:hypothetical protein